MLRRWLFVLFTAGLAVSLGSFGHAGSGLPAINFDWNNAKSIRASSGGIGGVFFVTDSKGGSVVVKFADDAVAPTLAYAYLTALGLNTPVAVPGDKKQITYEIGRLVLLQNNARVNYVYHRTVPNAGSVLLQAAVKGESLPDIQHCFRDPANPMAAPLSTTLPEIDKKEPYFGPRLAQASALLKAIGDRTQMVSLGKTYAADILLGNGDRLSPFDQNLTNLSNIMLDENGRFVLIDNGADGPSLADIAWKLGHDEIFASADPGRVGPANKKSLKKKILVSPDQWVKAVLNGSGRGSHAVEAAVDVDAAATAFVGGLKNLIKGLVEDMLALRPGLVDLTSFKNPKSWHQENIWPLKVASSVRLDPKAPAAKPKFIVHMSSHNIDWQDLNKAFRDGIAQARIDAANPKFLPLVFSALSRQLPKANAASAQKLKSAIEARTEYVIARTTGKMTEKAAFDRVKNLYSPKTAASFDVHFEYYFPTAADALLPDYTGLRVLAIGRP